MSALIWKGKELKTMGEVCDAVTAVSSKLEALEFMDAYRKISPHADANIGFASGFFDSATMEKVQDWFEVSHPVFGRGPVGGEVAFAKGLAAGREMRNKK